MSAIVSALMKVSLPKFQADLSAGNVSKLPAPQSWQDACNRMLNRQELLAGLGPIQKKIEDGMSSKTGCVAHSASRTQNCADITCSIEVPHQEVCILS
jgi:hypothetical protein